MKKTRGLVYFLGILLFGGSSLVQAANIEITADFRPTVTDKNHNTFRNTTRVDLSSACARWPHECAKNIGRSQFRLSSSGEFTVYLKCDKDFSQQDGECALTSEKSSRTVPVRAFLTLASNTVVKDSQKSVTRQPLRTTKDLNHNIFRSNNSGNNYPGHIDFEVSGKQHIDTLLTDPPDTYKSNVTIVFDANVHT